MIDKKYSWRGDGKSGWIARGGRIATDFVSSAYSVQRPGSGAVMVIPANRHVYMMQGVNGGPVKIGHANDLLNRLATLQVGHPESLRVIASSCRWEGLRAGRAERALHERFALDRLRGEWFSPTEAVLALAREMGGADGDCAHCRQILKEHGVVFVTV